MSTTIDAVVVYRMFASAVGAVSGLKVRHLAERGNPVESGEHHFLRVSGMRWAIDPRHNSDLSCDSADVTFELKLQSQPSDTMNLQALLALPGKVRDGLEGATLFDAANTHKMDVTGFSVAIADFDADDDTQLVAVVMTVTASVERYSGTDLTDPPDPVQLP